MNVSPAPAGSGPARPIRSRLVEWDGDRGFGYAEAGGERVFVHRREFVRKFRPPRRGDRISFVLGEDARGRPCAKSIEALGGGGLRFRDFAVLLALLALPALALRELPWSPWIPAGFFGILSLLAWREYRVDKESARTSGWRVPEGVLQTLALCGGRPGAYLAQRRFRHKTAKASFQFAFRAIVLLHQAVALDLLLGWPGLRGILDLTAELLGGLPS